MATDPTQQETAIAAAIQQVTASAQAIVRDEIELAKLEMTTKAKNAGRGAAIGAAAGVFVLGALVLILHGIAWMLADVVFSDHAWLGFLVEAVILLVFAAIAGLVASKLIKKAQSPVPTEAIAQGREIQAVVVRERDALTAEVREVIVKPEDQRS